MPEPMSMSAFFADLVKDQYTNVPLPKGPLDGKVVIITGSNRGLGMEAARHIVRLNADTLVLAVRNVKAGEQARKKIIASQPKSKTTILVWELDQASFATTRSFADRVNKELPRLDALILNAALVTEEWMVSPDCVESTLQVNVLSPVYLALLLYPKLVASADTAGSLAPHITFVSSDLYLLAPFPERTAEHIFNHLNNRSNYDVKYSKYDVAHILERYKLSKLFELYTARAIADYVSSHDPEKLVVNVINPGLCKTDAGKDVYRGVRAFFFWVVKAMLAKSAESGSRTLVHASTQCGSEAHGAYLSMCKIKTPGEAVTGPEANVVQHKLWREFGEVLTKQEPTLSKYFE